MQLSLLYHTPCQSLVLRVCHVLLYVYLVYVCIYTAIQFLLREYAGTVVTCTLIIIEACMHCCWSRGMNYTYVTVYIGMK
jgi:hypothetical protein